MRERERERKFSTNTDTDAYTYRNTYTKGRETNEHTEANFS